MLRAAEMFHTAHLAIIVKYLQQLYRLSEIIAYPCLSYLSDSRQRP